MTMTLKPCLCILLLAVGVQGAKVTPMEKVISLLKDLSAKVTAEGKEDAKGYDKYACFCKEQASDKLYAIEKSEAKIKKLSAQIDSLQADLLQLAEEISTLEEQITALEEEIKTKTDTRDEHHKIYLGEAAKLSDAISACDRAIEALKESKGEMTDAKTSLKLVQKAASEHPLLAESKSVVSLISKINEPGQPAKFQYQSNDIIATLEDLLARFKSMKADLDKSEFDINSAFEKNKLSLENEKKFAEQDKDEKAAISASKEEEMNKATADKDEETADMNADDEFMKELTGECEKKAQLFDQRSDQRVKELTALSDATKKLEEGAVPNYSANKKLVGLAQKNVVLAKATKVSAGPVAFVQIESVQHHASVQRVQSFLDEAVSRTGSRLLSALAVRVKVAEDHFVKVRQLIKDLISKLEQDALNEATHKKMCDGAMKQAVADRDDANANIEAANAKITTLSANIDTLKDEVNDLNAQIAQLTKALLEATELRAEEKATNAKTIAEAGEGKEATKMALEILEGFYKGSFAQTGKYVPPKSDREGNTVGDLAPETFDDEYQGAKSEGHGIIGILEVIVSDFERTVEKTEEDEEESRDNFETFASDTKAEQGKKEKRIKKAEGEISDAESERIEQQNNLKEAKGILESAEEELSTLKAQCVDGEETWEERKKKREEEIEALKQALAILEDWQS